VFKRKFGTRFKFLKKLTLTQKASYLRLYG